MKILKLICEKSNSRIWEAQYKYTNCLYKEIYCHPHMTVEDVIEGYRIASSLKDDVIKIYKYWQEEGKVCALIEYLDGWDVITKQHHYEAFNIIKRLLSQGVIDWDVSFLNFMVSPEGQVKMIDVDRLIEVKSFPECPNKEEWKLTWLATRLIKILQLL